MLPTLKMRRKPGRHAAHTAAHACTHTCTRTHTCLFPLLLLTFIYKPVYIDPPTTETQVNSHTHTHTRLAYSGLTPDTTLSLIHI